jgi:hypothetical protein
VLIAAGRAGVFAAQPDLSDDIIWSMNTAEYWVLLGHERACGPDQFTAWLTDAWTRLLWA